MRWTSTRRSIKQGQPSVLAIVETVVAIAAAFALAQAIGSIAPYVIGVCIAPLVLLRTPASTRAGVNNTERWDVKLNPLVDLMNRTGWSGTLFALAGMFPLMLGALAIGLLARVAATVTVTLRRPLYSFASIPRNWYALVLCADSATSPELVPGASAAPSPDVSSTYGNIYTTVAEVGDSGPLDLIFTGIVMSPMLLPAYLFRLSIKATAPFYLPLIWTVQSGRSAIRNPRRQLKLIRNSGAARIGRVLAIIAVTIVILKIWAPSIIDAAADLLRPVAETQVNERLTDLSDRLISAGSIPFWQLASAINGLIAWALYLATDWLLATPPQKATDVGRLLAMTFIVRRILSAYAIACTVYILASATWPAIRLGPAFPW